MRVLQCGIDGRMQKGSAVGFSHVFVGGKHPTESGARLLPLWGPEETMVIHAISEALRDSIPQADFDSLLHTRSYKDLPRGISVELWHLVGGVERRCRWIEAVAAGGVAPLEDALLYFGIDPPLRLADVQVRAGVPASATIVAEAGRTLTVKLPEYHAEKDGCWIVSGIPGVPEYRVPFGDFSERYLLSVLSAVTREARSPFSRVVESRIAKIRASDR